MYRRALAIVVAGSVVLLLASSRSAAAAECSATALCPGAGACTIGGTHNLTPGCLLDFGSKAVTLNGVLQADVTGAAFEVRAGGLTLAGGKLRSLGNGTTSGGAVTVAVTGAFTMSGSGPLVDTSAGAGGGNITLTAGSFSVGTGAIRSNGGNSEDDCGDGGAIALTATGAVLLDAPVESTTPGYNCAGGDITVDAASIEIRDPVDVSGGDGPFGITLNATAGGIVVTATGSLGASGKGSDGDGSGADGSSIDLSATGTITLAGDLTATGTSPDGDGGDVSIDGGGDATLAAAIDVGGNGGGSGGGDIAVDVAGALTLAATADLATRGDAGGGDIDLTSGADLTTNGILDVRGAGGGAGDIAVDSGDLAQIAGTVDGHATGGGDGGSIVVDACQVEMKGLVDVTASGGGTAQLLAIDLAGGSIVVRSTADLLATPCPAGIDCIRFMVRSGSATVEPGAVVDPPALPVVNPLLNYCCGNGGLDPGETCDDGNRLSCDGCSLACATEPSPACPPDGNECTLDCNPAIGCAYQPLSGVPCSDEPGGNLCTQDVCQAGTCSHPPLVCDDGVACTVDGCDPGTGCNATPDDAACADATTCTSEVCNPVSGCEYTNAPNGTTCSDADLCTTGDRCQAGACAGTGNLHCDDGSPCTVDTCSPNLACVHTENAALCPCTVEGSPLPPGTPCADGNSCSEGDTCDGAGACVPLPGALCDDGDPCTLDGCFGVCLHVDQLCPTDCTGQPDGAPCSDGAVCTTQSCQGGSCVSAPAVCGDSDDCNGIDFCLEVFGCRGSEPPIDDPACAGLDHFTCYKARVSKGTAPFVAIPNLPVEDAFEALSVDVKKNKGVCTPTDKDGESPGAPDHDDHLESYDVKASAGSPAFVRRSGLVVTDSFGTLTLDAIKRERLLVPTALSAVAPPAAPVPPDPDHFECYKAKVTKGTMKFTPVPSLPIADRFGTLTLELKGPSRLCLPTNKDGEDPTAPDHPAVLLCYKAKTPRGLPKFVSQPGLFIANQFGPSRVDALVVEELCVPATLGP
jgi:cysteine-rich repeat protein